jgi:hypothetical protein
MVQQWYIGNGQTFEGVEIGNLIIVRGEKETYTSFGNTQVRLKAGVELMLNEGGEHTVFVDTTKTLTEIVNGYPANSSMRFRVENVEIQGFTTNEIRLVTGETMLVKFDTRNYGAHLRDLYSVGDIIPWIEFSVYDIHFDNMRVEGVIFAAPVKSDVESLFTTRVTVPLEVTANLTLAEKLTVAGVNYLLSADEYMITWTSSDETVIGLDGTVVRPAEGELDAEVTLTATITYDTEDIVLTFVVTVLAEEPASTNPTSIETFTGMTNQSYTASGTIQGDSGILWTFVDMNKNSDGNGDFAQLRNTVPSSLSATFTGGLDSLQVSTLAFGGGRSFDIIINKGQATEVTLNVTDIGTTMLVVDFADLGIEGEFTIEFTNMSHALKIYEIKLVHQPAVE